MARRGRTRASARKRNGPRRGKERERERRGGKSKKRDGAADGTSRSKNGRWTRKDKGLFRAAMCRERAGGLPRTSNISSFVERAKKRRRVDWKKKRKIYWKETRCKCIRLTVKSTGESVQKVSLHQRQVITYTRERPEFKVEVNYLARDLRLGRHLPD